ncbi:MAG: hypothetical protein GVY20_16155 [Bacteroidetes bacterium]|jgi:phenylacetate-CoA ligase|nr:hypothetical protein [Bacteroidota bacterium]
MKFKILDYLYPIEIAQLFRFLKSSKAFSYHQLVDHQNEKLRSIIRHAYQHVPYYRELFDENGINPKDIQTVDDLPAIPVLTKEIIRERYDDLIADNADQFNPYENMTSGSTGAPTKFLQGKNISIARFAFFWRIWKMAGYRPYMKWAQVDGMYMGSKENLWHHNRMLNSLQISAYNLDHQNCGRILDKLSEFKPKILRGYPTALYTLARHIDHNSYEISLPLKSIITYSENLPPVYRKKIAHVFNCPVFDLFSQWEGVCLISECKQNQLHQHMEYSAMELLDKNNQPVGEKVEGEITATSFYNYSMPFIRYKTGDLATWGSRPCDCGMDHKVVDNISGRMVYVLFDTEENLVPFQRFQIYSFVSDEYAEGLFQAQIVQDSLDKVKVYLVVKNRSNTGRIEKEFTKSLKSRLGDGTNIEFVYTDTIPKKKNGKLPFIRNNLLNKEEYWA